MKYKTIIKFEDLWKIFNFFIIISFLFNGMILKELFSNLSTDKNEKEDIINNICIFNDTSEYEEQLKTNKDTRNKILNDYLKQIELNSEEKPEVDYFSLLIGGNETNYGMNIALDNLDNIIIVGMTGSTDFPTLNAFDSNYNGEFDVFVSKFTSNGSLLWSSFLGGTEIEMVFSVGIDSSNNIIVTGYTSSIDFPILNAFDNSHNGKDDVFISKFSSNGSLLWSSFLGGTEGESTVSIIIDSSDNIIVTGDTSSIDFPTLETDESGYNGGNTDVFITKISSAGSLIWSKFLGGNATDLASSIIMDSSECLILTGLTDSTDFPMLKAYNTSYSGNDDIFVTKLSSTGYLLWSTYFGGSNQDIANDIVVDSTDNIILTGNTESRDFPIYKAYYGLYNGGSRDIFITKFNNNGSLLWSTFFGGSSQDSGVALGVNRDDNIIITGNTYSTDFPILSSFQIDNKGYLDCFVSIFYSSGSLNSSSYFGGSDSEYSHGLAINKDGSIIIVGETDSIYDFPTTNNELYTFNPSIQYSKACFLIKFDQLTLTYGIESNKEENKNEVIGFEFYYLIVLAILPIKLLHKRKKE